MAIHLNNMLESAIFFKQNGYVKIKNFIEPGLAFLFYRYVINETKRLCHFENINPMSIKNGIFGTFDDVQASNAFSKYGDLIFDTLLELKTDQMSQFCGVDLIPTYSYHRLYIYGNDLKRHKDRPSCEISATLCLGYDISNVDKNKFSDYNWPMYVKSNNEEKPINLEPGDIIIYRGCDVEHWREPFIGNNHAQVFLHYNEKNNNNENKFDGRPVLGIHKDERECN